MEVAGWLESLWQAGRIEQAPSRAGTMSRLKAGSDLKEAREQTQSRFCKFHSRNGLRRTTGRAL
jgi:hypothetical protein